MNPAPGTYELVVHRPLHLPTTPAPPPNKQPVRLISFQIQAGTQSLSTGLRPLSSISPLLFSPTPSPKPPVSLAFTGEDLVHFQPFPTLPAASVEDTKDLVVGSRRARDNSFGASDRVPAPCGGTVDPLTHFCLTNRDFERTGPDTGSLRAWVSLPSLASLTTQAPRGGGSHQPPLGNWYSGSGQQRRRPSCRSHYSTVTHRFPPPSSPPILLHHPVSAQ